MILPNLHYISQGKTSKEQLIHIQNACIAGVELVQLRLKNAPLREILKTAEKVREITNNYQTKLIINDYYKIAKEIKADGVHLGKNDTCPTIVRKYLGASYIIGGTANTLQDCNILIDKKVDYIGLGPYRFTTTKEQLSPIIGLHGYSTILKELKTTTPIIAIGGITLNDVTKLLKTGIYGIAASSTITKNFNSVVQFNQLLHSKLILKNIP